MEPTDLTIEILKDIRQARLEEQREYTDSDPRQGS